MGFNSGFKGLITFKAHIRQKPKYIYRHNELSRYYNTSEKSIPNIFFLMEALLRRFLIQETQHTTVLLSPASTWPLFLHVR